MQEAPQNGPTSGSGPEGLGYTLWMFDGSEWQLKKDCSEDGATTGPRPTLPGKFKGQIRAVACIAA